MTTHVLETGGQVCPFPLIEAQKAMAELPVGDRLRINFDCTQATESIPEWAAQADYPVTSFRKVGSADWTITVEKA